MNVSKRYSPARIGRTTSRGHPFCAVRCSLSSHPVPLPWGEGEPFSRGEQSRPVRSPLRVARCFLSLRERIKVRGNGANHNLAYRIIPGIVDLDESAGRAGGFLNDY